MVLPLAFYRGFAEQFSIPKLFLAKCLVISGLVLWALGGIWTRPRRRAPTTFVWALLAFSFSTLISCLASPVPRFSLLDVEFALCGPAWVLLLAAWERGESAVYRIVVMTGIASGLVAGVTLCQRFGFDPLLLGGYQVDWGSMVARMRLYSTFGNPNFVGGYLIATIFAALALAAISKSPWGKAFWLATGLVTLAAIVETGSRGAWLGLAFGLAVAARLVLPPRGLPQQSVQSIASLGTMAMFVAPAAYGTMAILALSLAQRIVAQICGRVYLWNFSWPIFWQHPFVGSGWGSYQLLYLDLQGKFLAAHPQYSGYWTNNRLLHNDPLQLLLETGLLGFAAFVWVLWIYGREALRVRRQTAGAWPRLAIAASVAGIAAILVDSTFNYQFAVPPTYILLFTLLTIPFLLSNVNVVVAEPSASPRERPHAWGVASKVAGSAVIIVVAGGLLWQQIRVLESERWYQTASEREDHNDLEGAEDAFRHSIDRNALNGRAYFGLSRVLYSRGQYGEALQEILPAERTYADSHQEVLRARILDQMGRNGEALEAYRHALWLDPTLTSVQEDIDRLSKGR